MGKDFFQFVEDMSSNQEGIREKFAEQVASIHMDATSLKGFFKDNTYEDITDDDCKKISAAISAAGRGMIGGPIIQY